MKACYKRKKAVVKLRCNDGKVRSFRVAKYIDYQEVQEAKCLECGKLFDCHDTKVLKPLFLAHVCGEFSKEKMIRVPQFEMVSCPTVKIKAIKEAMRTGDFDRLEIHDTVTGEKTTFGHVLQDLRKMFGQKEELIIEKRRK